LSILLPGFIGSILRPFVDEYYRRDIELFGYRF